jgi:hypothetical protein
MAVCIVLLMPALSSTADACNEKCQHAKVLALVNNLRNSVGKPAFLSGPNSMLDNAVEHSRYMLMTGDFQHQDLGSVTAKIGCDVFCSGENIAWYSGGSAADAPERCFRMWEKSPGHYRNMVSDNDYTTIGIFAGSGGRVYCTQTFGKEISGVLKTFAGAGQCDLATGPAVDGAPAPVPTGPAVDGAPAPVPAPAAAPAPVPVAEDTNVCTAHNQRCAGESGRDFIPYQGCCSPDDECVPAMELGWGKFCVPRTEALTATGETTAGPSTANSNTKYYDYSHRYFALTGRHAVFAEECTYHDDGSKAICILCLEGKSPPVCLDSRTITRTMRDPVTYDNAF